MQDVAEACGVSKMTISLALRNDPRVTPATRDRVHAMAATMGYSSNPYVSTLMAQMRTSAKRKSRPVIAFLNLRNPPAEYHQTSAGHNYFVGAQARAEELGFQLEEFAAFGEGMIKDRLEKIWHTRNIHAVLIGPAPKTHSHIDMHWERYAAAKFGFSVEYPPVNFVTSDHFQCIQLLLRKLVEKGYRRIGFAIPGTMDERVDHRWIGSLLSFDWHMKKKSNCLLFVPPVWGKQALVKWCKKEKPEVVVSFEPSIPRWLEEEGWRIPGDVGFATVDWSRDHPRFSGINPRPRRTGALAIDLVVEHIHRNEWGIPQESKCILVPGEWMEGETLNTPAA